MITEFQQMNVWRYLKPKTQESKGMGFSEHKELIGLEKTECLKGFTKSDWKNPITRESLIKKLQQFYQRETYPRFIISKKQLQ